MSSGEGKNIFRRLFAGKSLEQPQKEKGKTFLEFPFAEGQEYSPEELERFFTDEILRERVLYIPEINKDLTDDVGMFGFEPGFVFVEGVCKGREGWESKEARTLTEYAWAKGLSVRETNTLVLLMDHWYLFPSMHYDFALITPSRRLQVYEFLTHKLGEITVKEKPTSLPVENTPESPVRTLPKPEAEKPKQDPPKER